MGTGLRFTGGATYSHCRFAFTIFTSFLCCFYYLNSIAIPLSTIALWGCIAVLAFSPISFVAAYLGKLVWGVVWLLNHSVLVVDAIPFALWNGLLLSLSETIVLYFISATILYWLIKKKQARIKPCPCRMVCFWFNDCI